jgi:hypothetical protein
LDETIWSLTLPRIKRISGSKNFRSPPQKDFRNNIGTFRTCPTKLTMSVDRGQSGPRACAARPLPTQVAYPLRPKLEMLFHSACESVDRAKQLTFPAPSCLVVSARTRAVHKNGRMPTSSAAKVGSVGIGWRQANCCCGPLCRILVSRRWSANHTTSNRQSKQRAATEEQCKIQTVEPFSQP